MKTVVLTPLFPPDPSTSAQYTKQLVQKLPPHNLSVIAYGKLPESVPDVEIFSITKRSNKFILVFRCLKKLLQLKPIVLIVQNGPSTELPAILFSFLSSTKILYIVSDQEAAAKKTFLQALCKKRAGKTITLPESDETYLPTEWLPFGDSHNEVEQPKQTWWNEHLKEINSIHD